MLLYFVHITHFKVNKCKLKASKTLNYSYKVRHVTCLKFPYFTYKQYLKKGLISCYIKVNKKGIKGFDNDSTV